MRAIGFAKIEMNVFRRRLVAGGLHVEPLERIGLFARAGLVEIVCGIGELRGEFGDKFRSNFVTTRADGRANRGQEIDGLAAEFELHTADDFLGDASEGAAPSGVNGGYGSFLRINQKNRDAVGSLDGQELPKPIRSGSVTLALFDGRLRKNAD